MTKTQCQAICDQINGFDIGRVAEVVPMGSSFGVSVRHYKTGVEVASAGHSQEAEYLVRRLKELADSRLNNRVQIEFDSGEGWFSANVTTGAGGTILDANDEPIMETGKRGYAKAKAAYLDRWPGDVIVEQEVA